MIDIVNIGLMILMVDMMFVDISYRMLLILFIHYIVFSKGTLGYPEVPC